ncbi:MAG TPA: MazG nucleotide pyrophosphohydrolase domain-containing protein [Planctomycetota bacterium]|jgi:NTP pyrophosphatase (non-canonical NTP hydrolase)|nr:MazG nucleotide pyrophosphohydrolase domain-containing protein [Planctomycetota bacterium]
MDVREFQSRIEAIYFERDAARGWAGTFSWFAEEVGELARARRKGDRRELEMEFADCLAWLATLASIEGVDLEGAALLKYGAGCPRCGGTPCACTA